MEENPKPQTLKGTQFRNLKDRISSFTLKAVREMGFKFMTEIQSRVIPKALDGSDIVATAKTGSGKTLAFLIPAIKIVRQSHSEMVSAINCIIICPTRELAMQCHTVLKELLVHDEVITSCLVIGGEKKMKQSQELREGAHIVVATPGRLLDHMRSTSYDYEQVKCLILDEADKMFQYGFEEDLKQIISRLPKDRQTMLFSATHSERTEALIKTAMKDDVYKINIDEDNLRATVEGLKQGYVICDVTYRMWWLQRLLHKTKNKKVMVFFSSCKSAEFHHEFFTKYCDATILCIHGKMNQIDRTNTLSAFYKAKKMILFCTDLAARGLDIPAVDWIVQFDPPSDANEYIHRVGRTARGLGAAGNAVLLLRPEEKQFITYLKDSKIFLDKYETWDNYFNLQPKIDLAMSNKHTRQLAVEAYEGYIRALEVKKQKHIFNVLALDLDDVAKSFGLNEKPDVDLCIGFNKKHRPRKRLAAELASTTETSKHFKR